MGIAERSETIASAERAMKRRRFAEAIGLFDAHLEEQPGDLEALLKVGICHLFNRSERTFMMIHRTAGRAVAALRRVPERLSRLWERYDALFKKVSAAALIMGSAALTGCSEEYSGHKYSGGVEKAPVVRPAAKSKDEGAGPAAPADEPKQKEIQKPKPTFSAHRYSAGVYHRPRPKKE
jgi:hypothetical protein